MQTISLWLGCLLLLGFSQASHASLSLSAAIGAEILEQFKTGKLRINKIVVEKPYIFPEEELQALLAKYQQREISVEELKQLQSTLSRYYFENGYVNSGVIIPNQTIENGEIHLKVIHGRLSKVKIKGNNDVPNKYIYKKIKKGITVPLNAKRLQQYLGVLRQDPLIADVKANLYPGDELGQSILQLDLKEASPYYLNVQANNHQSVSIGQYRLGLNGGHRNLTGRMDQLQGEIGVTEGLTDAGVNYTLPLNYEDLSLSAKLNYSRFSVIDPAFAAADIKGASTTYGVAVNYPFIDDSQWEMTAHLGLDIKSMDFEILGEKRDISLDAGDNSAPLVFGLDIVTQRARLAAAASLGLRQGTALNKSPSQSDTQFTIGSGQAYIAYRPYKRLEWVTRLNGQLASQALPTVEKFPVGGANSVRGYRENLFVRDSGFVFSTQLKVPVYRARLFVVPFIDYGRSFERAAGFAEGLLGSTAQDILSVGGGAQWQVNRRFHAELFWGYALSDVSAIDETQQDNGFHFALNYTIY